MRSNHNLYSSLRECCISFSMTSYKRCNSLQNHGDSFTKDFYPIYYNVIPYLLGLNVGKTKKANSGLNFSKLMARYGTRASYPQTCCVRCMSSPVHRAPAGRERLLSTRGSPVGFRAPRGEDTSEPVPRPQPGASGVVRSGVRIRVKPK